MNDSGVCLIWFFTFVCVEDLREGDALFIRFLCSTVWSELWRWVKCTSWAKGNSVTQMHEDCDHLVVEHFFVLGFITYYLWKRVTNVIAANKWSLHVVDLCTVICRKLGICSTFIFYAIFCTFYLLVVTWAVSSDFMRAHLWLILHHVLPLSVWPLRTLVKLWKGK